MQFRSFLLVLSCAAMFATASSAGAADPHGSWALTPSGDQVRVAWTAPLPLPVTSDRVRIVGADNREIGRAQLTPDRRTVVAFAPPGITLANLRVVRSGHTLDRPSPPSPRQTDPDAGAQEPQQMMATGPDPWQAGPYAIATERIMEPPIRVAGMSLPVEMVSYVVAPTPGAQTGPRPIVVFLHGMHEWCDKGGISDLDMRWPCRPPNREMPNHEGYAYIQRMLASQGYFTISIRANGVNAQDLDGQNGARARAALVQAHLDRLVSQATQRNLDLSRVVLVGHSRGGEGVNLAATQIDATDPYRIVGIIHIGSVNFARQATAYIPTLVVLPYCDGDVVDLQGQSYVDRARDLTSDDTAFRSTVVVMGANHNFFNTMWSPGLAPSGGFDDWVGDPSTQCRRGSRTRLKGSVQRRVEGTYVVAATRLFAAADTVMLPLLDGSDMRPTGLAGIDVKTVAMGGDRTTIRPGPDATPAPGVGMRSLLCRGVVLRAAGECGHARNLDPFRAPHWYLPNAALLGTPGWDIDWTAPGGHADLRLRRSVDLTSRALDMRVIIDPERGPASFSVELTDESGATALAGVRTVRPMPGRAASYLAKYLAQNVRFSRMPAGVDLSRITSLTVRAQSMKGRMVVLDASAVAGRLSPVPNKRLPRLSVGRMTVVEGDPPTRQVALLPYRLSAPLNVPGAAMMVAVRPEQQTENAETDTTVGVPVTIPAGTTSGTFQVPVDANRAYDGTRTYGVMAFGIQGVATDEWSGAVRVNDNEPRPTVRTTITRDRTGIHIAFRSTGRTSYRRKMVVKLTRGTSRVRALRVGQVSRGFLDHHAIPWADAETPLFAAVPAIEVELDKFTTRASLHIPLRSDYRSQVDLTLGLRIWEQLPSGGRLLTMTNVSIPAATTSSR